MSDMRPKTPPEPSKHELRRIERIRKDIETMIAMWLTLDEPVDATDESVDDAQEDALDNMKSHLKSKLNEKSGHTAALFFMLT